jgi:hypothetical protein
MHKSLIVLSVLALAGCGAGAKAASSPNTAGNPPAGQSSNAQPPGFGASGLLAAINGNTLQVQSTTSQTAVTYNSKTGFTDTIAAKASDVTVGQCVQVRSAPAPGNTGSAPTTPPTAVTATSVRLRAGDNGTCSGPGGFAGGGGRRFNGGGGTPPSGFPGGSGGGTPPSGFPGGRGGRFGGGASGLVTAVHGSAFTVASNRRGPSDGTSTAPASTTPVTVTTTSATTYSRSAPATAAALKVGLCVTARGQADSTGTVAATLIALRPADNGSCANGFGGGGGRGA